MVHTMSRMHKIAEASDLMQLGVLQISKFRVTGMHCSSCSTAVQKALSVTPGVERASVSLTLEQAEVVYDPGLVKEVSHQFKSQTSVMIIIMICALHIGNALCMAAS